MKKRVQVWGAAGLGLAAACVVGGAVAFATIPSAGGIIHGCLSRNGDVRLIDTDIGQRCRPFETAVNWNQTGPAGPTGAPGLQGPPGPQGPAGSVLAYAHVNADGTIEDASDNITVVRLSGGTYCVGVTGGTPRVAVANLDSRMNIGGSIQTGIFHATGCPPGATDLLIVTRPHNQDGGFPGADRAFYLLVN